MRLGQLARHLDTSINDITEYLATKGIEKNSHPNVKLNEEDEASVIAHFRPDLVEATVDEEVEDQPTPEAAESTSETEEETTSPEMAEPLTESEETLLEDSENTPETSKSPIAITAAELNSEDEDGEVEYTDFDVIKAPKVELPGLKVVGKIDLPEPKVKEETAEEDNSEETKEESTEGPKVIRHNRKNARRQLTEEEREARRQRNKREKAKRIARQEARRKEQEERRVKEIKENHYKQKINKPVPPTKLKKKKASKAKSVEEQRPQPKTVLGKFWRWLNT